MKIEKTALLALGAAMASGAALASNTVDKAIPNVLLILVDDLGLGDLSCQYAKDLSTPNIDRIFEKLPCLIVNNYFIRFRFFCCNSNYITYCFIC